MTLKVINCNVLSVYKEISEFKGFWHYIQFQLKNGMRATIYLTPYVSMELTDAE